MAAPYASDAEHLADELRRIDSLVRAQALRWKLTTAATKPDGLWGMLHVSAEELDAYLRAPFAQPGELPPGLDGVLATHWDDAAALRLEIDERVAATEQPTRLARLVIAFDLSGLERDILLVALLSQLETRYQRLFGVIQDDASRAAPAVFMLRELLQPVARGPDEVVSVLRGSRPLRTHGVVELDGDEQSPLPAWSLRVDERIADFLAGGDSVDPRLRAVSEVAPRLAGAGAPEAGRLGTWLRERRHAGDLDAVVLLSGPYGAGHERVAGGLCSEAGIPLVVCDVGAALESPLGWQRSCVVGIQGGAPAPRRDRLAVVRAAPQRGRRRAPLGLLVAAAEAFEGLTLFASEVPWDPAGRLRDKPFVRIDLPAPGFAERMQLWERELERSRTGGPGATPACPLPRHELSAHRGADSRRARLRHRSRAPARPRRSPDRAR